MSTLRVWLAFCALVAGSLAGTASGLDMQVVPVGNPHNAPDTEVMNDGTTSYGAVGYGYRMGKFEVTAAQYTVFLNAVARTDAYGLFSTNMWSGTNPCYIQRGGSSGSYTYSVASDWANRPVTCVSWADAARFANWMHNGQPIGAQAVSTTEDGSYFLNGATSDAALMAVTRKAGATWVIPTDDEWYKAAYYDPNKPGGAGYWNFPTRSEDTPSNLFSSTGTNNANWYNGGYTLGPPYYRTEVGTFAGSPSAYDTFDMGGNVWEWNESVYASRSARSLRGSAYGSSAAWVNYMHAANRNYYYPELDGYAIGFRLAQVPETATMALALAGAGLLARRRRTGD